MINFIVFLITGGILGGLASIIIRKNWQQGVLMNVAVGISGAFLAGIALTPLFGISTLNQSDFSGPAFLAAVLGAIVLLAIVNFVRRGTVI
jgi:uncharacterized membrane protein YeaQ/YmgE (transglycosylase-associated protein family)